MGEEDKKSRTFFTNATNKSVAWVLLFYKREVHLSYSHTDGMCNFSETVTGNLIACTKYPSSYSCCVFYDRF